jgi:hypothetical protein
MICSYHSSDYEDYYRLGCDAVCLAEVYLVSEERSSIFRVEEKAEQGNKQTGSNKQNSLCCLLVAV